MAIENIRNPDLGAVVGYKTVYLLCSTKVDRKTKKQRLKAEYYTFVEITGPKPVWALYTIRGIFKRLYSPKSQIERDFPNHVWRKTMAKWNMFDIREKSSVEERRAELKQMKSNKGLKLTDLMSQPKPVKPKVSLDKPLEGFVTQEMNNKDLKGIDTEALTKH